jgi:hypothetical protein
VALWQSARPNAATLPPAPEHDKRLKSSRPKATKDTVTAPPLCILCIFIGVTKSKGAAPQPTPVVPNARSAALGGRSRLRCVPCPYSDWAVADVATPHGRIFPILQEGNCPPVARQPMVSVIPQPDLSACVRRGTGGHPLACAGASPALGRHPNRGVDL